MTATSSAPGTSPDDALKSSDKPGAFWSANPGAGGNQNLTVQIKSEPPATVIKIKFTLGGASSAKVVLLTPEGSFVLVRNQIAHRCSKHQQVNMSFPPIQFDISIESLSLVLKVLKCLHDWCTRTCSIS